MAGGLGAVSETVDPSLSPLAAANPLADSPAFNVQDQISGLYQSAGDIDPIAILKNRIYQAQNQPDLGPQLAAARTAMDQDQAGYVNRLEQQYSPERESQLNWGALGKMGAAMMQPGGNQWAEGQKVYQNARAENQGLLDLAGDQLTAGKRAMSREDYADLQGQQKLQKAELDTAMKEYIDYQKAIKTANGGSEWDYKVVDGALWLVNKLNPMLTRAVTDKSYAKMITDADLAIHKEANDHDAAFLQQAGGDQAKAAQYKADYIKSQLDQVLQRIPKAAVSEPIGSAAGQLPVPGAAPGAAPTVQPDLAPLEDLLVRRDAAPVGPRRDALNKQIALVKQALANQGAQINDETVLSNLDPSAQVPGARRPAGNPPPAQTDTLLPVEDLGKTEENKKAGGFRAEGDAAPGSGPALAATKAEGDALESVLAVRNTTKNGIDRIDRMLSNPDGFKANFGGYNAYLTNKGSGKYGADFKAELDSLRSELKTAGLSTMRADGSIGAMTEKEWPIVESMLATLTPEMSEEAARKTILDIRAKMLELLNSSEEVYNVRTKGSGGTNKPDTRSYAKPPETAIPRRSRAEMNKSYGIE